MTLEIEINGRVRVISIEPIGAADPSGGAFRIRMHPPNAAEPAVVRDVEMRATDLGLSLIHGSDRRTIDAALTPRAAGDWLVQLPHVNVTATVDGRRLRRGALEAVGSGAQRVTAPMPGRIVRVLVKPGDQVQPRQALLVIEAMKMENELVAARAGTVAEIAVTEGMSVEAGRFLVRVDSTP